MTLVAEVETNPNPSPTSGSVAGRTSTAPASTVSTARTETVFSATPGLPQIFQSNFDYQLARGLLAGAYGDGGAVGESFSTARRIKDKDIESWTVEWAATAERIEGIANECFRGGHLVSAREAFMRASVYWRTGFFYLETKDPRQFEMYQRHRSCFRQAAKLFDPQIEPVSIPYENGKTLPGYFMRAAADGLPRPTVMLLGGGDSTCEEMYDFGGGAAAVRRGYNALLWEGPGQVGAFAADKTLTYRPDYEVPTRYAVDYVLSRTDVDPKRLALAGNSMGGYFAPRAVAFEKRIAAVIANSLLPLFATAILALLGLKDASGEDLENKVDLSDPMKKFLVTDVQERCGMAGRPLAAFLENLSHYNLAGLEGKITCPLLSVGGEGEGSSANAMAHEFFEKLSCPKTERLVTCAEGGEAHCQINNPSLKHQIEFDWLDDVLK
jgi:pimeloyl-ACP methyl ester carboxylesterase